MVNEYRDSINLGKIEVSRKDLKLSRDGTYKFSIEDFREIESSIESGWRFPTENEFKYIHSISKDLEGLDLGRNCDYWINGKSKPHPIFNNSPYWELHPCAMIVGNNIEFEYSSSGQSLRIRLVKDL